MSNRVQKKWGWKVICDDQVVASGVEDEYLDARDKCHDHIRNNSGDCEGEIFGGKYDTQTDTFVDREIVLGAPNAFSGEVIEIE